MANILYNNKITGDCHFIWLESSQIAREARPGQFVMVRCGDDTLLRRPLSIHRVDGNKLALLFAVIGKGTAWLSQRKAGDEVEISGPLGNGFHINSASHKMLLVAGGMGLAPLAFLAEETLRNGCQVELLCGAAKKNPDIEYLVPSGIEPVLATEDGTAGYHGLITDLVPRYIDWADQVFACGPAGMYRTMARMPELKGTPVQVSLEIMMGCGRGVCYGCTIRTKKGLKKVCQDGPVFDIGDILWEERGRKEGDEK